MPFSKELISKFIRNYKINYSKFCRKILGSTHPKSYDDIAKEMRLTIDEAKAKYPTYLTDVQIDCDCMVELSLMDKFVKKYSREFSKFTTYPELIQKCNDADNNPLDLTEEDIQILKEIFHKYGNDLSTQMNEIEKLNAKYSNLVEEIGKERAYTLLNAYNALPVKPDISINPDSNISEPTTSYNEERRLITLWK